MEHRIRRPGLYPPGETSASVPHDENREREEKRDGSPPDTPLQAVPSWARAAESAPSANRSEDAESASNEPLRSPAWWGREPGLDEDTEETARKEADPAPAVPHLYDSNAFAKPVTVSEPPSPEGTGHDDAMANRTAPVTTSGDPAVANEPAHPTSADSPWWRRGSRTARPAATGSGNGQDDPGPDTHPGHDRTVFPKPVAAPETQSGRSTDSDGLTMNRTAPASTRDKPPSVRPTEGEPVDSPSGGAPPWRRDSGNRRTERGAPHAFDGTAFRDPAATPRTPPPEGTEREERPASRSMDGVTLDRPPAADVEPPRLQPSRPPLAGSPWWEQEARLRSDSSTSAHALSEPAPAATPPPAAPSPTTPTTGDEAEESFYGAAWWERGPAGEESPEWWERTPSPPEEGRDPVADSEARPATMSAEPAVAPVEPRRDAEESLDRSTPAPATQALPEGAPGDLVRSIVADICPGELLLVDTAEAPLPKWADAALEAARDDLDRRLAERTPVHAREFLQLAIVESAAGLHDQAEVHLKEALPRSERFGPFLNALAVTSLARGKVAPAIVYCKEALRETGGDDSVRAAASSNLGDLYDLQDDAAQAIEAYEAAIDCLGPEGEPRSRSRLHFRAGNVYRRLDQTDKARRHLSESVRLCKDSGDEAGQVQSLAALGSVLTASGSPELALTHLDEGVRICLRTGDRSGAALLQGEMGLAYMAQDQLTRALAYLENALSLYRELGDRRAEAGALGDIGKIHEARGDIERARQFYDEAAGIQREQARQPGQAEVETQGSEHVDERAKRMKAAEILSRAESAD